jgi:carboxyl-terminal processing protease
MLVAITSMPTPGMADDSINPAASETSAPLKLTKTEPERAALLRSTPWIETIEREVPPLTRDLAGRFPMILWHGVGFDPLSPAQIDMLRKRGLCQHLQINTAMIPTAQSLAAVGMPVILMEGRTDSWPYSLADETSASPGDWAHQFDITFQPPWFGKDDASQWHGACPHRTEGWLVLEKQTRATMQKFKDAGVRVDAVLVDYEGDPYPWNHLFEQLRHCRRCRKELPPNVIHDRAAWRAYSWQQYVQLYDRYFAKPIREVYPQALVTNWHVVHSSQELPVRYFARDVNLPELRPQFFSASNPIAYASDAVWRERWNPASELTQNSVDDFFTHEIIQQVDSDRQNRLKLGATSVRSIPWVSRVCRISPDLAPDVPVMSRPRYRMALQQLWKLEVHSMQIFNPMHEGYEELAIQEVQDAVAALEEMLKDSS